MIVKVQWPLTGDEILIYNRDRTICQTFPVNEDTKKLMFEDKTPTFDTAKQYFHARISKKNNLVLLDRAPKQRW